MSTPSEGTITILGVKSQQHPSESHRRRHQFVGPFAWLAVVGIALAITGCGDSPEASPPPAAVPESAVTAPPPPAAPTGPRGVDAEDDPGAPRALPKTGELPGWTKTKPVRIADVSRLSEVLPRETREPLDTFHIDRASVCTYEHDDAVAAVTIIDAKTPEDALGIFALLSLGKPGGLQRDGSLRAVEVSKAGVRLTAWQGHSFVEIRLGGRDFQDVEEAGLVLFQRIVFNMPAADPPLLLRLMPPERRAGAKLWMVRDISALRFGPKPTFKLIHPPTMNERLGLDGDRFLSVAALDVEDEDRDNIIWLTEFEDAPSAGQAYERYQQALIEPQGSPDDHTLIETPKGPYLFGSWTADQESIQNILPRLRQVLPGEETRGKGAEGQRGRGNSG